MDDKGLKRLADRALILRCQLGEDSAFERLVGGYHRRLRYFIRQLVGSTDVADDVLQEIWVTVFRKIATLRSPDAFVPWLYSVARHKAYHAIRRPAHVHLKEDCEVVAGADEGQSIEFYDGDQVHGALGILSPEHREVLILRYFEQMPYSDIAEAVGCPVGTIRSRLNTAKRRMRDHLERTDCHEQ